MNKVREKKYFLDKNCPDLKIPKHDWENIMIAMEDYKQQFEYANQYRTAGLRGDDGKTLSKDGYYALRMNVMVCRKKPIEGEDECVKIMEALHDDEGWVAVGPKTVNPSTSEELELKPQLNLEMQQKIREYIETNYSYFPKETRKYMWYGACDILISKKLMEELSELQKEWLTPSTSEWIEAGKKILSKQFETFSLSLRDEVVRVKDIIEIFKENGIDIKGEPPF